MEDGGVRVGLIARFHLQHTFANAGARPLRSDRETLWAEYESHLVPMSMIETPPEEQEAPPTPSPSREARGRSGRYRYFETHELITLIDEIDDERSRARFREAVYLAVILWLSLFLLYVFLPRYLPHAPVLMVQQRNPKELTYLDTPPDLKQRFKNHPSPRVSERSTEAQAPKPTKEPRPPEPKAGAPRPPAPKPQPQQQASRQPLPQAPQPQPQTQPQAQPPQQAKVKPTPRPANPPPLADAPAPSPQKQPNFGGPKSAATAIADAAKGARGGGSEAGDYGSTGRGNTGAGKAGVQVLSDMQGVDFDRYLARLLADVRRAWLPLIPEECNSPLFKQGITGVRFTIQPDGTIRAQEMRLDYSTHDVAIDRAAWGSIRSLGQTAPLPKEFHGPNLELRIEFRVNKDKEVQ